MEEPACVQKLSNKKKAFRKIHKSKQQKLPFIRGGRSFSDWNLKACPAKTAKTYLYCKNVQVAASQRDRRRFDSSALTVFDNLRWGSIKKEFKDN